MAAAALGCPLRRGGWCRRSADGRPSLGLSRMLRCDERECTKKAAKRQPASGRSTYPHERSVCGMKPERFAHRSASSPHHSRQRRRSLTRSVGRLVGGEECTARARHPRSVALSGMPRRDPSKSHGLARRLASSPSRIVVPRSCRTHGVARTPAAATFRGSDCFSPRRQLRGHRRRN